VRKYENIVSSAKVRKNEGIAKNRKTMYYGYMHRYGAAPVMVQGKMSSQDCNMRRTEMVHAPMVQGTSRHGENKLKNIAYYGNGESHHMDVA